MAKKKIKKPAKKVKKTKKSAKKKIVKKTKKIKPTKKAIKKSKPTKKTSVPKTKEKLLGKIDHFFDKISVAAIKVVAPFKVGDVIHVKGHTTDFYQRVDSMQIEHREVSKVKKGDDVGMKVKDFVRDHDAVYRGDEKSLYQSLNQTASAQAPIKIAKPAQTGKTPVFQTTIFKEEKPILPAVVKPSPLAKPMPNLSKPEAKKTAKADPYSNTRFFKF